MTPANEYFIHLIYCALKNETPHQPEAGVIDWGYIFREAALNNLVPLLFTPIAKLPSDIQPSFMHEWSRQMLLHSANSLREFVELGELMKVFATKNIDVMMCKGVILASLYPNPALRVASDADLLTKQEDLDKAIELLLQCGFTKMYGSEGQVFEYLQSPGGLLVDLQTKVWRSYSTKDKNLSDEIETTVWQNRITFNFEGYEIQTLGITEHLFYIICHIAKHFIGQGIGIRHLIDLTLYIQKYYDVIDWMSLWEKLNRLRLEKFTKTLLCICEKYLGLEFMINDAEIAEDVVDSLLADILDAGVFGAKTIGRSYTTRAVMDTYYSNKKNRSRFAVLLSNIFPSRKNLDEEYSYAKKTPSLIPIAWVHRAFRHIFRKNRLMTSGNISSRTDSSMKRLEMLKNLSMM